MRKQELCTIGDVAIIELEMFHGSSTHHLRCYIKADGEIECCHTKIEICNSDHTATKSIRKISYKEYLKLLKFLFSPAFPMKIKNCNLHNPLTEHFWIWALSQELFEFDWEDIK